MACALSVSMEIGCRLEKTHKQFSTAADHMIFVVIIKYVERDCFLHLYKCIRENVLLYNCRLVISEKITGL